MNEVRRTGRTRRGASRALACLALIPVLALLLATSASATGVTAVEGGAFGESVTMGPVISGPTPAVTLPPAGTISLASVAVPGFLQTGVLNVSSQGTTGPRGSMQSSASVANIRVGAEDAPALTASAVSSRCEKIVRGSSGSATTAEVKILGVATTVPTFPNATVNIPGVGSLTTNEHILGGTPPAFSSITVNALHLRLNGTLGTGDIIVAQSRCSITIDDVVVPSGAIGGVLLTGLVAVVFAVYQVGRSRTRRGDLIPALAS